jgi:hypothetical protein
MMSNWQSARLAAPVFVGILVLFALFHDKAYTVDDPFFLLQAEQALLDPLDPSGFDIVWGPKLGRASEVSPTGPGMAYLLTPTVALGGREWVAHATVLAFLALAAFMGGPSGNTPRRSSRRRPALHRRDGEHPDRARPGGRRDARRPRAGDGAARDRPHARLPERAPPFTGSGCDGSRSAPISMLRARETSSSSAVRAPA